jgi:hypothetical protein
MTKYDIGLLIFMFFIAFDVHSLKKEVRSLSFKLMNKVDKPPEETPTEKFTRERNERIARLEKESAEK